MGRFLRVPHWLPITYQALYSRRRLGNVVGLAVQAARSRLVNPEITCHRPMIRNISWSRKRLSIFEILPEQVIECCIWVSMICRMRYSLRQRERFEEILKSAVLQKAECFL